MPRYTVPECLRGLDVQQAAYERWLTGRAAAHRRRDTKRAIKTGREPPPLARYCAAIHEAVVRSQGLCEYTGAPLAWDRICTWNNDAAQVGGAVYKRTFGGMPTVDHVHGEDGRPIALDDFKVTSWELNDAKGDLSLDQFVALCRRVLASVDREPTTSG